MGIYAQVPGQEKADKVEWLINNTHMGPVLAAVSRGYAEMDFNTLVDELVPFGMEDPVLLCTVDNGPFIAVAVVTGRDEYERFMRPGDARPKALAWISKAKLKPLIDPAYFDGVKSLK